MEEPPAEDVRPAVRPEDEPPDDQLALEGTGQPLDFSRLPARLPVIRENAESEVRGVGSSYSSLSDPVVSPSPSQDPDDVIVLSYQGQELPYGKAVDVYVEMKDNSKLHLARYEGWRFKILDPLDVPQARRLQLTDRRQVMARFPHEEPVWSSTSGQPTSIGCWSTPGMER